MAVFTRGAFPLLLACAAALTAACGGSEGPTFEAVDRPAGERAPRSAACDEMDPTSCLLPWPSNVFTVRDTTSATGLRLAVQADSLDAADDPSSLNRADGFSRMTPIFTGFDVALEAPPAEALQVFLVEPGIPGSGELVPLRLEVRADSQDPADALLIGRPRTALAPGAEYVVVVTDALRAEGGGAIAAERGARVALGVEQATSQADADLFAYHAPARAVLAKAGVEPEHVLRLWDFTTRSADDATRRLVAMRDATRAAVLAGETQVVIDVVTPPSGAIAAVVEGRLSGLPSFATEGGLSLDADGLPVATGTHDAPFRVEIPQGQGDYPFLMFGHGTGGSFHDGLFDQELAKEGIGKVGISFYGWTDADVIDTFLAFVRMCEGTHHSTAFLMQAVADSAAIQAAMVGPIGDALSEPLLGGAANPAVGRRPDGSVPLWAGGSLGGTMGLVFASADPDMEAAVINVPGGGWTHFIPPSSLFATMQALLKGAFGGELPLLRAHLMTQSSWDDVDGALWTEARGDRNVAFLIQESIGDPVLPNVGTENVALATGAVQLGAVLSPFEGIEPATEAAGRSALTQFRVPDTDGIDIHGFAARDTPAGAAAREQIRAFVVSVLAGKPLIQVPSACPGGSCDFAR